MRLMESWVNSGQEFQLGREVEELGKIQNLSSLQLNS